MKWTGCYRIVLLNNEINCYDYTAPMGHKLLNECGSLTQRNGHGNTKVPKEKDVEVGDLGLTSTIPAFAWKTSKETLNRYGSCPCRHSNRETSEHLHYFIRFVHHSFTVNYEVLNSGSARNHISTALILRLWMYHINTQYDGKLYSLTV